MNINWQKLFVSLTILALGLTLAGCGKTASDSGGGSSGLVPRSYTRTSDTVYDLEGLLNALNNVDDVIIPANAEITVSGSTTVVIPAGKNLILSEGATLNVSASATIELSGAIRVKDGAAVVDAAYGTDEAQQWQQNNSAELIFEAGSRGYRYATDTLYIFVGAVNDTNSIFNLTKGELIFKRDAYELRGNADVISNQYKLLTNQKLTVAEGSTVTVKSDGVVTLEDGSEADLRGEFTVESGGALHVKGRLDVYGKYTTAADDNWSSGNDTGTIVYHYGATGIVNNEKRLASDNDATALQLGNGAIFEMTKTSYTVAAGTVISKQVTHIGGDAPVKLITVKSGANLTLNNNLNVGTSGTLTVESGGSVSPTDKVVNNSGTVSGLN
jgi:hypothetical protein